MSNEEQAVDTEEKDADGAPTENAGELETDTAAPKDSVDSDTETSTAAEDPVESGSVEAKVPQFSNLNDTAKSATPASMSRFLDVSVQVSAELGSIKMPIGDVLQLSEGSVIELNRNLSEPVDLVAQGVRIARGEVVVIDDCFAIRIREIESNESY